VRGPRFHLDHLFTRRRLSDYVDGELAPGARGRVERHLEDCPDCSRAERSLRRLVARLPRLRGRAPRRLPERAVERVRAAERGRDGGGAR
jgi:anti-sigma factor RsiW